ncbi:MAG: putative HTH-type transcriptional regulator [Frondihabitans sp.]|nr:putative HTH-type transcriptional regulator [Frondihabitans sp.]
MPISTGSKGAAPGYPVEVAESRYSGRQRSERARVAILSATRDLIADVGYERVTIEAIAARAAVGKQTVYRWWPSKGAVVADAVLDADEAGISRLVPAMATIDSDIYAWGGDLADQLAEEKGSAMLRALAIAASEDALIAQRLYDRFTGPFHAAVKSRLTALCRGGTADTADLDAAADMLLGSLVFRVLTRAEPLTRARAETVIRLVLRGLDPT